MITVELFSTNAFSQEEDSAFWRQSQRYIKFNQAAKLALKNLYTHTCTDYLTINSFNANGTFYVVPATTTITLTSSPGVAFYSDIDCEVPVTSTTINATNNTASVFVKATTLGKGWISASAPGFRETWEDTLLIESPFTWTGGSGVDLNWNTGANWLGGVMPSSTHLAVFTDLCTSPGRNCNVVLNTNVDVGGVEIVNTYPATATITQNPGVVATVRNKGWRQLSGIFLGGNADFNFQRRFRLLGGSFTSPTTRMNHIAGSSPTGLYNQFFTLGTAAVFNHNNASVRLTGSFFWTNVDTGNHVLNNLEFYQARNIYFEGSLVRVDGNLIADLSDYGIVSFNVGNTVIEVRGNVTAWGTGPNIGYWSGPSVFVKLIGNPTSTPQVVTTTAYPMSLPHFTIDTGTKPVVFNGHVGVSGLYKVISVGTLTTAGSTLSIRPRFCAGVCELRPEPVGNTITYNNVKIFSDSSSLGFANQTFRIQGTTTFVNYSTEYTSPTSYGYGMEYFQIGPTAWGGVQNWTFLNGTILSSGNVVFDGLGTYNDIWREGNLQIRLIGNPAGQTVSSTRPTFGMFPNLEIDSGPNVVNLVGALAVSGNIRYTSGVVQTAGSTMHLTNSILNTAHSVNMGTTRFDNLNIMRSQGHRPFNITGTLFVDGNLSITTTSNNVRFTKCGGKTFNVATIALRGNFTVDTGTGFENCQYDPGPTNVNGPLALQFVGSAQQLVNFTGIGTVQLSGNVTVNNPLGISLSSDVDWDVGATQIFTMLPGSGDVLMNGRRLDIRSPSLNGGRIIKGGGSLYVNGALVTTTGAMFGGFVDP
jgi:hypothetical protein